MICEGLPQRSRRHSPADMPESHAGKPPSHSGEFNYIDSQRWPPGFDTVAEWIEHACRLDTLESDDVTSSELPDGRRCDRVCGRGSHRTPRWEWSSV
jgi:hypothetical protein